MIHLVYLSQIIDRNTKLSDCATLIVLKHHNQMKALNYQKENNDIVYLIHIYIYIYIYMS